MALLNTTQRTHSLDPFRLSRSMAQRPFRRRASENRIPEISGRSQHTARRQIRNAPESRAGVFGSRGLDAHTYLRVDHLCLFPMDCKEIKKTNKQNKRGIKFKELTRTESSPGWARTALRPLHAEGFRVRPCSGGQANSTEMLTCVCMMQTNELCHHCFLQFLRRCLEKNG